MTVCYSNMLRCTKTIHIYSLWPFKKAKQEGTKLKALELMGKACGLFTPTDVQDKAVITADQLKRELSGHMKLLEQAKASVLDVDAKRLHATPMPVAGAQEGV